MLLAQDVPAGLRRLQELEADFAEALWVLDQPRGQFNLSAMVDDTLASLVIGYSRGAHRRDDSRAASAGGH